MRKNKEKALEIQRKRKEKETEEAVTTSNNNNKRARVETKKEEKKEEEDCDLEPFEEGASEMVTKTEAQQKYCLPLGTLECCKVVEKENPRHKQWAPMKLYYRAELRRRARKRFGGLEGLVAERKRRLEERFRNDIEKTKDIFKK